MSSAAKENLRAQLKQKRASAELEALAEQDAHIAEKVIASPEFDMAPYLFTYLSFGKEVDTRAIIKQAWAQGKRVALPKCQSERRLSWHLVDSLDSLVASSFGMNEPDEQVHPLVDASQVGPYALALVPGLAFDQEGYRLGYGGGFYDRFLQEYPGISWGLCRESSFLESLRDLDAVDSHDLPVDRVIT